MKKKAILLLAAVLGLSSLTGCAGTSAKQEASGEDKAKQEASETPSEAASESSQASSENSDKGGEKLRIVTTIFPIYDWVREIAGERMEELEVTWLLDDGVDLHSFQPTVEDMVQIAGCDLFVYVGGESDEWVEDALEKGENPQLSAVSLMDVLGDAVREEEVIEGMQEEDEHDHDDPEEEEEDMEDEDQDEEEEEYDEHVWLSLKNAQTICSCLAEEMGKADEEHADIYTENAKAYIEKLAALDKEYEDVVSNGSQRTILVADRFPFRYLTDDYGLSYYAAFVGCSAETEASFETVAFLAQKADELGLSYVVTTEASDHKIAETVIASTEKGGQEIVSLDSMQSTKAEDAANGVTYLSLMEKNLETLKKICQ